MSETPATPAPKLNRHRSAKRCSTISRRSDSDVTALRSSASSADDPSSAVSVGVVRTNEPLPGRVTTRPASRSAPIALFTVPMETTYSLANVLSPGSWSPGARSPLSMAAVNAPAICKYGGRESSGSSFPMSPIVPRGIMVDSDITQLTVLALLAYIAGVARVAGDTTGKSPGGAATPTGAHIETLGASMQFESN